MKYILKRFESLPENGRLVGFEVTISSGPTRYFEASVGIPIGVNLSDNEICLLAYRGLKNSIDGWAKQEMSGDRQSIALGSEFIPPDE